MYNTDLPTRAELPTSRQLIRSTVIAILAAIAVLVTIVLPAEFAIDPTGIGRFLGLSEMGEIKVQLAEEARRDRELDKHKATPTVAPDRRSSLIGDFIVRLFVSPAAAQSGQARSDETILTLGPGEGREIKLVMEDGAKANFSWSVAGGLVNFDMHGENETGSASYEKGRGVASGSGVITAAFTGDHGWFWRNRGRAPVTVTLKTTGNYSAVKRLP